MILNRCALKNSTYMPTSSFGCCTSRTRGLLRADIVWTRSATELVVPLMLYVSRRRGVWRHVGLESTRKLRGACRRTGVLFPRVTAGASISLARASDGVVSVHQARRTRPDRRAAQRTTRRQTLPDRTASIRPHRTRRSAPIGFLARAHVR